MSALTLDDLAVWRGIDAPAVPSDEATLWQAVIDAVEFHFAECYTVPLLWESARPDIRLALLMQCNRLLKRPDSPEGVAGFAEFGVVRIGRFDPDIDDLLAPVQKWETA